jgi:hypothetical protein
LQFLLLVCLFVCLFGLFGLLACLFVCFSSLLGMVRFFFERGMMLDEFRETLKTIGALDSYGIVSQATNVIEEPNNWQVCFYSSLPFFWFSSRSPL